LAVRFCCEDIFECLQWWQGRAPSDDLLLGVCIILIGLAFGLYSYTWRSLLAGAGKVLLLIVLIVGLIAVTIVSISPLRLIRQA